MSKQSLRFGARYCLATTKQSSSSILLYSTTRINNSIKQQQRLPSSSSLYFSILQNNNYSTSTITTTSKLMNNVSEEINDMEIKSWEIIRNKLSPSHLPKGSTKYLKELDRLIYQYVSKTRRLRTNSTNNSTITTNTTTNDVALINSLSKLSETLKQSDSLTNNNNSNNNLGVYMELINISCYFGYLPFALHLINHVHNQFKFTLDYKTYRDVIHCFIENQQFDECFNFIVELEDLYKLKPNYQLYLPLYLAMKEILAANDKKASNFLLSQSILNQMIPRLSQDSKLLNDVLGRDKFTTGLLGRNTNVAGTASGGGSDGVGDLMRSFNQEGPLGYYQDYDGDQQQWGEYHHHGNDHHHHDHEHCGDESCGDSHGTSEVKWWNPNERALFIPKNEWESRNNIHTNNKQ